MAEKTLSYERINVDQFDTKTVGQDYIRTASAIGLIAPSTDAETIRTDPEQLGDKCLLLRGSADITVFAGRNLSTQGLVAKELITGFRPGLDVPPIPGITASKETKVVNGTYRIDVGKPTDGGIPGFMSSFEVNTFAGDIVLNATPMGSVILQATGTSPLGKTMGNGIVLSAPRVMIGSPPTGPTTPATPMAPVYMGFTPVIFEQLMIYLQALHMYIDTHIHADPVSGVTGPPVVPSLAFPGIVPYLMPDPITNLMASKVVTFGG